MIRCPNCQTRCYEEGLEHRFRRGREVWLCPFCKNDVGDPKKLKKIRIEELMV